MKIPQIEIFDFLKEIEIKVLYTNLKDVCKILLWHYKRIKLKYKIKYCREKHFRI